MNIRNEFTEPECERFRRDCNFTPEELEIFNLRVKDNLVAQIHIKLREKNIYLSERTIERRLRSIKNKIIKVI